VPHRELDQSLKPFFQFHASSVERFGSETVRQTLEIANQPSTYVSGRVILKGVQQYFTDETIRLATLRDPFYELALRLWSIAIYKQRRFSFISERDAILFEPAMSYFSDMDFSDSSAIKSTIKAAPKDILTLFESPFTHQLVAASPSDKVSRDAVSGALDALSQFTLFSADEEDNVFALDIAEFLGVDASTIAFAPARPEFLQLAEVLRSISTLEHVLENDLILHHFIRRAEDRALRGIS
jgi:hypothetical protein